MSQETKEHPFISFLESHNEDRAMLAELRRGLGQQPGEVSGMFPYVIPFVNAYNEADIYMIASLFSLHPSATKYGNMGTHLKAYVTEVGDDAATTRRFVQLMRMRRDSLEPRLRQHISLLKSKDISVNWHQLISDLNWWEHDSRNVQKQWASAYWQSNISKSS